MATGSGKTFSVVTTLVSADRFDMACCSLSIALTWLSEQAEKEFQESHPDGSCPFKEHILTSA